MRALVLRDKIPWFGNKTGYEQLPLYLSAHMNVHVVSPRRAYTWRRLGSLVDTAIRRKRAGAATTSEIEVLLKRALLKPTVTHLLYGEPHLRSLEFWERSPNDVIATLHLPASVWSESDRQGLKRLSSALVLYQKDLDFFERYIGKGRVRFVRYGVDCNFFYPNEAVVSLRPRLLFSGVYLRNNEMLVRIVHRLLALRPEVRFDFLVPLHARETSALKSLIGHSAVTWHAGLSDEELRILYQQSYLLLLPMSASGANTAIVEALASGLPIVTTDVGGIKDYGGGNIYPLVANDHDNEMVALVEQYLRDWNLRVEMGRKCRLFTEAHLSWPAVAKEHVQAYRELVAI
jgi:glycosyltransferase involved in cell wall biosynthesis